MASASSPLSGPSPSHARPRLAVMLSGSGRTLLNLLGAIGRGELVAEVGLVIASRECPGAERAREAGLRTMVMPGVVARTELGSLLDTHAIDLVVLAGYLRLLEVPEGYRGRIVNIHPALLPRFGGVGMYGERVHEAVLSAGCTETGCTVHMVDDRYDDGPVVARRTVPVLPGDTAGSLAARVFAAECEVYPRAIAEVLRESRGLKGTGESGRPRGSG